MAQSYYTLEQAAEILGKSTDDLRQMARRGEIRSFADGGSWKFRTQDIDDLKQTEDLLAEYGTVSLDDDSDMDMELKFDDAPSGEAPLASESDIARSLQNEPISKESGESDVRLIFSGEKLGSDSDIALVPDFGDEDDSTSKPPTDSDIRLVLEPDDEVEEVLPVADVSAPPADSTPVLKELAAESATSEPVFDEAAAEELAAEELIPFAPAAPAESPAEVAPPAPISAGSTDSGILAISDDDDLFDASDDDLVLEPASTPTVPAASQPDSFNFDEDELGVGFKLSGEEDIDLDALDLGGKTPTVRQGAGDDDSMSDFDIDLGDDIGLAQDITPGAGDSGINLARPDDSGILLAKASTSGLNLKKDSDTSESEFDVSLDSDDDLLDSDELPAFKASDTAPRMAPMEEDSSDEIGDSDFDIVTSEDEIEVEDESGSDVVALDDDEDSGEDFDDEDEEEEYAVDAEHTLVAAAQPAPWGGLWVGFLSVTTIIFVVVMMMMYEITRNAWSYNEPYPLNATIIQTFYDIGKSAGLMP